MITKFCIVCLCMTAGAMVGVNLRKRKRRRMDYFAACEKLTDKLTSDISFRRENLFTILDEFAAADRTALGVQIRAYRAEPYDAYRPTDAFLRDEEQTLIGEFLSSLGSIDAHTQLRQLSHYRERFASTREEEEEKFKQTGMLGLKLSILIGLAIGILLI